MRSSILIVLLIVSITSAAWADQAPPRVLTAEGKAVAATTHDESSTLLLDADAVAAAFGWELKRVDKPALLVACRADVCVPIQLEDVKHTTKDGVAFVDAAALGAAMGFNVETKDGMARLVAVDGADAARNAQQPPAYHEDWGDGRGFDVGQTLPDVPLIDLDGNEVRFGKFLGKRYILYGWASW